MNLMSLRRLWNTTSRRIASSLVVVVVLTLCGLAAPATTDEQVSSTGAYTVTGGAGAFANATGSGTIDTEFNLCTNTANGTYTGTISKPHSN